MLFSVLQSDYYNQGHLDKVIIIFIIYFLFNHFHHGYNV